MIPRIRRIRDEAGQTLVMSALLMAALVGMVGLTADVGLAFREKAKAQGAADAAVLASVQSLAEGNGDAQAILDATQEAITYAAANGISASEVTVNIPPSSGPSSGDAECVEVEIASDSPAYFSRVLDFELFPLSVRSVACMESAEPFTGLMPWAILESAIQYNGSPSVIKYNAGGGSNGNYGALRLFGSGSANYEDNIKFGVEGPVCAQSQPTCIDPWEETEPGNMIGGTRDGVNYRLDNTMAECDDFAEVFAPDGIGGFQIVAECDAFNGVSGSGRVLLIPVIDSFCNGNCTVTLKYFVLMFLNDLGTCTGNSCEVTGTFIKRIDDPSVELGFTPGDPGIGPPKLVE